MPRSSAKAMFCSMVGPEDVIGGREVREMRTVDGSAASGCGISIRPVVAVTGEVGEGEIVPSISLSEYAVSGDVVE